MAQGYLLVVDSAPERRQLLLRGLEKLRAADAGLPRITSCSTPAEAIAFSAAHDCPIVFTSVDLPGMDGFTMIRRIREQNRQTNFILLADCKDYIIQALRLQLRLSGYIIGAPDVATLRDQLDNLWFPLKN